MIMDFDKLFTNVMELDSTIRYAAIQNSDGKKISGGFRENISPILSEDELKMMHYYASQRWQTRKNIEHKIGITKYAMAEYDKIKRISFPINEKEIEEQKKQQKFRISVSRAARRSGKINKKEGKVNRAKAKAKTPRSQKKIATVRKSRY